MLNNLGDGSTLTLDFTTGVLDPRLSFSRSTGGSYVHSDGLLYGFDTSSSSNTIGTGSKTFTLSATAGVNRRYAVGDLIIASSGANNMSGSVTSYDPTTQALVCSMASSSGSGTFTTWIIGNRQPRFDHDPTTLAARGLLVEAQAVNNVTNSDTLPTGTSWTANSLARTNVSTVTPDGNTTTTTCGLSHTGSGSFRSAAVTVLASTAYTFSFWVKNNGGSVALYRAFNVSGSADIVSETSYFSQVNSSTWTRIQFTFTTPVGCTSVYVYPLSQSSGTSNILVWGAQLEAGSGASSYIPTGASTATRVADECVMTGTNFSSWFNAGSSYSMLFRYSLNNPSAFAGASVDRCAGTLSVSGGGNRTFIHAAYRTTSGSGDEGRFVRVFDTGSLDLSPATLPAAASNTRLAFAVDTNNAGLSAANQSLGTDSGCTILTGQNQLELGKVGASQFINGCISLVKYWPTRLPNATLQSLTT
jgi:hypothetical protein